MNWYQLTKEQVLEKLGVTKDGLSSKKAEELLLKNGENVLQEGKRKPPAISQSVCGFACNYSYYCCNYFNVFW